MRVCRHFATGQLAHCKTEDRLGINRDGAPMRQGSLVPKADLAGSIYWFGSEMVLMDRELWRILTLTPLARRRDAAARKSSLVLTSPPDLKAN
jgi:hypothetical protein